MTTRPSLSPKHVETTTVDAEADEPAETDPTIAT